MLLKLQQKMWLLITSQILTCKNFYNDTLRIQEGSIANFEEVKGIKSEALDISKLPAVPALPVSPNKKAKVETQN